MDIQAELANAIKQRYAKVHGVPKTIRKTVKQNGESTRRQETALSKAEQASRRESKKAAAAALMAKMGGGSRQPISSSATSKSGKKTKSWEVSSASTRMSSTVTGGDPLSKTEEETAQRYRKMMKMGLTEGAVRHKMISDGVSERIVEAVMSAKNSSNSQAPISRNSPVVATNRRSALSLEEEEIAEKYRRMAKIGTPEGAIRHKMLSDGVSERIVEAVNSGDYSTPSQTASSQKVSIDTSNQRLSLTLEEERICERYRKMAKIGMPEGAIRHKMTADGVSEKIQDAVMAGDLSLAAPSKTATNISTAMYKKERNTATNRGDTTRSNRSSLSTEEEKIAAQYRRMIKIKMPDGAVRHKMIADGVSQKIQDSVLAGEIPETLSPVSPPSSGSPGGESKENISSLSREDETKAAPYRKMMRMGMPEGAVKHKMTADRISTSIQNSVLRGEIPAQDLLKKDVTAATHMHPQAHPLLGDIASSGGIGALKRNSTDEKKPTPAASSSNPLLGAIASSGGIGSLKKTSTNKKKPTPVATSSNPLLGAIASSGGIGSLKKTSTNKKKPTPAATSSNPLLGAIASSGGIRSLKKTSTNKKKPTPAASPSNPLLGAIASSGGIGSLKKTSTNVKKPAAVATSSNPLLGAIASSGGIRSLKKTSTNKKKPTPAASSSNPLLSAIASSGGIGSLKKTSPNDMNLKQSKLGSGNTLLDELSSRGFSSSLKKTLKKAPGKPTKFSTSNGLTNEINSNDFRSKLRKSPQKSPDQSPDVSNSDSLTHKRSKEGYDLPKKMAESNIDNDYPPRHPGGMEEKSVTSPKQSPKENANVTNSVDSRRHLGGIKVKSVRSPKETFEESNNLIDAYSPPRRHLGGVKVKSVRSREKSAGSTDIINTDDSQNHLGGVEVKSLSSLEKSSQNNNDLKDDDIQMEFRSSNEIKSVPSPKEVSELSTNYTHKNTTRRFQSGIKVKAVRLLEEKPKNYSTTGSDDNHSSGSLHSATALQERQATTQISNGYETSRLQSDNHMKSIRFPLGQTTSYASTDSGSKNSSKSFQFTDKIGDKRHRGIADANCQDVVASETDLEREMNKKIRNQTSRPRTKVRNSQLKLLQQQNNKRPSFITTEDGVDHHCLCILM